MTNSRCRFALIAITVTSALPLFLSGCQGYVDSTPYEVFEGDNRSNYIRIFGEPPPDNVEVLNSVVKVYSWRPGVDATDHWEIELLATKSWIEEKIRKLPLRKSDGKTAADKWVRDLIFNRQSRPGRQWYAPRPFEAYDVYYQPLANVPYVHMLVDREPTADGRSRVFLSKH